MEIAWTRILPVIVSIIIIIAVAILREYSKSLAAIVSTMPINIPLALWIISSGDNSQAGMESFTRALMINIAPTILFLVVTWLLARAGWSLVPMLVAGYAAWGVGLILILIVRQLLGV